MRPIRMIHMGSSGASLTDAAAQFVGTVIDERKVVDFQQTVLDSGICRNGGVIDLPFPCMDFAGREVKQLYYPAFAHEKRGRLIHLHQMGVAANMLLRVIASFEEGTGTPTAVQKSVLTYQYSAIRRLGGKRGIINSNLIAGRVKYSGRAVVVSDGDHEPAWVGIPNTIMARLHLKYGDLVMIGREPTIWDGSIEIVRARTSGHDAMALHPLLFAQFGADCDGDTMWVYKIPGDLACWAEAAEQVTNFTQETAKWPSFLCMDNPNRDVDWDTVHEETMKRQELSGYSVSPVEIMNESPKLFDFCEITGKGEKVAKECVKVASGISPQEFSDYVLEQNDALLTMKLWMGPVGAAANKLRVLAGTDTSLLRSASYLSERLQQILLDSKHRAGHADEFSVHTVLDILNRRDKFQNAYLTDIMADFEKMGIDDRAWRIMAWLWIVWPLQRAIETCWTGCSDGRINRLKMYARFYLDNRDAEKTFSRILKSGKIFRHVDSPTLKAEYWAAAMGLNELVANRYPLLQLVSDGVINTRDKAMEVAAEVFVHGAMDDDGIAKMSVEMATRQKEDECSARSS